MRNDHNNSSAPRGATYHNGLGNVPRLPERVVDTLIDSAGVSRMTPGRGDTVRDQTAQVEQLVHDVCEELLARLPSTNGPQAVITASALACGCPSGDGSLHWPCPQHPGPGAQVDERAMFKSIEQARGTDLCRAFDFGRDGEYANPAVENRWKGWIMARATIQQVAPEASDLTFQQRVEPWMAACFGARIAADTSERNHRFFEEATELVQAGGMPKADALMLVDYVYGRPVGELGQEIGGVMVTLAALCLAQEIDMHAAAEVELARIWTKVAEIRAKQASKPKGSPLPIAQALAHPAADAVLELSGNICEIGQLEDEDAEHGIVINRAFNNVTIKGLTMDEVRKLAPIAFDDATFEIRAKRTSSTDGVKGGAA